MSYIIMCVQHLRLNWAETWALNMSLGYLGKSNTLATDFSLYYIICRKGKERGQGAQVNVSKELHVIFPAASQISH